MAPLPQPDTFIGWAAVFAGFALETGRDPLSRPADAWLRQAADLEAMRLHASAHEALEAALLRDAYDRDAYFPPEEYQRRYGNRSV